MTEERLTEICKANDEARLLILPCKLTSDVYHVDKDQYGIPTIQKGFVREFRMEGQEWCMVCEFRYLVLCVPFSRIGASGIFLDAVTAQKQYEERLGIAAQ